MTVDTFKDLLRRKLRQQALKYLESWRGSKGNEMSYSELKSCNQFIQKSQLMKENYICNKKNRMVSEITDNFDNHCEFFISEETENMKHIYLRKKLNNPDAIIE